jgi:ABC-type molybdate transport system substrate-binding protein
VEGEKVTPQMLGHLKPGTAMATFTNGKYVNASGNHAAVVKEVNTSLQNPSVTVVEQWKNHPPVETTYYFNKPGVSRIHDMANYSVVMAQWRDRVLP